MKLKQIDNIEQYKLCYVEHNVAWFTKLPLEEQWGDDWDDAPYEYNAGWPYDAENLIKLCYFCPDLEEPKDITCNCPYSVKAINSGAVAWLSDRDKVSINAGCSIMDFISLVKKANGQVYGEIE